MLADYTYDRRTTPLLPLTEGLFRFLHTSVDRVHGLASRGLRPYLLGNLAVPSGQLAIGDPFAGMVRRGNRYARIPPGIYQVWQTLADVSDEQTGEPLRVAYLSLVLNHDLLLRRWQWQQERMAQDPSLPPDLPTHALRYFPLMTGEENTGEENTSKENTGKENTGKGNTGKGNTTEEAGSFPADDTGTEEAGNMDMAAIRIQSGSVALVDAQAFARFMPEDSGRAGQGWYDRLFDHGVTGSWFDRMDYAEHLRCGAANFPLPGAAERDDAPTVVLSQSGWGDGTYFLLAEYAFDGSYGPELPENHGLENNEDHLEPEQLVHLEHAPPLVALHLDFRVIPFDPHRATLPVGDDVATTSEG